MLLFPSSQQQFPISPVLLQVWAERGAADVSRVCVVMDVPYGRERAGGSREKQPGQAGVQLAGLQGWLADFNQMRYGKQLPHRYTSKMLFQDLTWFGLREPSLAKSSLLSVPLLLVLQGLFQPHSIPRKWGCLGRLWCMRHPECLTAWLHWVQEWISPSSEVAVFVHPSKEWCGKHFWT